MKYLVLFPLFVLPGCGLLEAVQETAADPAVQAQVQDAVTQGLSGNWVGAGWTLAGIGSLMLGNWVKKRVTNSDKGSIVGGPT